MNHDKTYTPSSDPEELQRYTNALKSTFEAECVENNDAPSCHRLAEFFQSVEKNPSKAAELYRTNCEKQNFGLSCLTLGVQYFVGSGVEKDADKGVSFFEKGCELGCSDACNNAGMAWRRRKDSNGPPADFKKAEQFFHRGCDANNARACFNLSTLYLTGGDEDVIESVPASQRITKDMARAFFYAVKSCELGTKYGCINAARQLDTGDGVPMDQETANNLRQRAKKLHMAR